LMKSYLSNWEAISQSPKGNNSFEIDNYGY
jgi:hypothetical protein